MGQYTGQYTAINAKCIFALGAIILVGASVAKADVIYTYTGSQFSQSGILSSPDNLSIQGISMTLDLSSVPADGLYEGSPLSLTVTDGYHTLVVDSGNFGDFSFQDGQITAWHMEFQFGNGQTGDPGSLPPPGQFVQQYFCSSSDQSCFDPNLPYTNYIPAPVDDFSFYEIQPNNPNATSNSFDYGYTNSEGSWTSSLNAAPEPDTFAMTLAGVGMSIIGVAIRRRGNRGRPRAKKRLSSSSRSASR